MLQSQSFNSLDLTHEAKATIISILKFIQKQPDAKHTAEGIAVHWVLQQRLEENLELVLGVIQKLVNAGLLEEVQKGDHQCYYRVNKSKITEIPSIISGLNQP